MRYDFIEDGGGDLVEILAYHDFCAPGHVLPWPGGIEHDIPDYCETCGEPVGNPLTEDGEQYTRDIAHDLFWRGRVQDASALVAAYGWIFAREETS